MPTLLIVDKIFIFLTSAIGPDLWDLGVNDEPFSNNVPLKKRVAGDRSTTDPTPCKWNPGEMSELAEGARLEIACATNKVVPRVRIPLSPPFFFM